MWTRTLAVLALAGCYRDSTAPIDNTTMIAGTASRCGSHDDLAAAPGDAFPGGRLRSQINGVLSGADGRTWAGAPVPDYIPPKIGTLELFLLDQADGGRLAFYRDPYNLSSCTLSGATNCAYVARFYDKRGAMKWELALNEVMSRGDHLEVQDIRLADGVVYFNEACQSYSSGANGTCSSLVAVDPITHRVLWRTAPLTSNGRFRLRGCYIVAGYGFTSEPDAVFLVERSTGSVLQKLPVSSSPEELTLVGPDRLDVRLYSGLRHKFRLDGMEGTGGRMVALDAYGGVGYGGATYGGMGYGGP